jgi:hypothetical protein
MLILWHIHLLLGNERSPNISIDTCFRGYRQTIYTG